MAWYAVFDSITGQLQSIGQQVSDTLPSNLSVVTLSGQPNSNVMWDETTRTFIARPIKVTFDRLQDIIDAANSNYSELQVVWNTLNATNRTRLRNGLIRLLGSKRFRAAAEPIELD